MRKIKRSDRRHRGQNAVESTVKRQRKAHQKADRINGLLRRQRTFLLEKLVGLNDKEAALAAGYALSIAENTKQKIWANPGMHLEFERLKETLAGLIGSPDPRNDGSQEATPNAQDVWGPGSSAA
jgi:hypothetical protein